MSNRADRLHYRRSLRETRRAFEANPKVFLVKPQQAERKQRRDRTLINFFNSVLPLRLFRVLYVKSVFARNYGTSCEPPSRGKVFPKIISFCTDSTAVPWLSVFEKNYRVESKHRINCDEPAGGHVKSSDRRARYSPIFPRKTTIDAFGSAYITSAPPGSVVLVAGPSGSAWPPFAPSCH